MLISGEWVPVSNRFSLSFSLFPVLFFFFSVSLPFCFLLSFLLIFFLFCCRALAKPRPQVLSNRFSLSFSLFPFLFLFFFFSSYLLLLLLQIPSRARAEAPGSSSFLFLLLLSFFLLLHNDYFGSFRDGIWVLNRKYCINFPFGSFWFGCIIFSDLWHNEDSRKAQLHLALFCYYH